jgi:hypothetical protein
MPRRSFSDGSRGDEQLVRQLPALLRQHRPDLMVGEDLYRSSPLWRFTAARNRWQARPIDFPLLIGAAQHIDTSHRPAGGPALGIECPHQGLAITAFGFALASAHRHPIHHGAGAAGLR